MIEAYVYMSCTSCRKTVSQLKEGDAEFTARDYFKERFTREELQALLDRAGMKPSDVLSKRAKPYKELGLDTREVSEDELLDLMIEEPRLLKRPLVLGNGEVILGHDTQKLAELIAAAE